MAGEAPKGAPIASARVGNYRAPVDTTGMDPEMKSTMGIAPADSTHPTVPAHGNQGWVKGIMNFFTGKK